MTDTLTKDRAVHQIKALLESGNPDNIRMAGQLMEAVNAPPQTWGIFRMREHPDRPDLMVFCEASPYVDGRFILRTFCRGGGIFVPNGSWGFEFTYDGTCENFAIQFAYYYNLGFNNYLPF